MTIYTQGFINEPTEPTRNTKSFCAHVLGNPKNKPKKPSYIFFECVYPFLHYTSYGRYIHVVMCHVSEFNLLDIKLYVDVVALSRQRVVNVQCSNHNLTVLSEKTARRSCRVVEI